MKNISIERCAVYARCSNAGGKSLSTEDQIRVCRELAQSRGWTEVMVNSEKTIDHTWGSGGCQ